MEPGRRTVLRAAAATGLLTAPAALAGCAALLPGERREPRPPTADELAVARAAADAVRLRDAALALAAGQPQLAAACRAIAAEHDEQLRALGAAGPSATPSPSGAPVRADARGQRDAELGAARDALRDALAAAAGPAVLLARIAAARAVHADSVSAAAGLPPPARRVLPAAPLPGATTPAPTTAAPTATGSAAALPGPELTALGRLLAGEHAAVFAYPLVVARCSPGRRPAAAALWQAHVAERDTLERRLVDAGGDPPVAAPGYDVGPAPADSAAAAALGARVESGLAALAVTAVGETTGEARLLAADRLVDAARRAATWAGRGTALPGGPAV